MLKVRKGSGEEIPLVQGKEQWLRFAGAAVKRYPASKVRETQTANLENSAVATGLEKVSYHSNSKEAQRQRMFKLPHNCTYFTQ